MPNPTATIFLPYHALDDVILRGTRAAQPLASAVTPGTLYCVTDEGARVERSSGTAWQVYSPTPGGGGAGTGDVVGPGAATDQAIALYDGTTGKLIQNSATTIPALTASITASVTSDIVPVDLATETTGMLPFARVPVSAASRLLGKGDSGAGPMEELTLGTGLLMTGTQVSAPGARNSALVNYTYSATLTEPPTAGHVRMNSLTYTAVTKVWLTFVSSDGQDVYWGVMVISPGSSVLLQDKNDHTKYVRFTTTALPIDKGTYGEIPVVWKDNGAVITNNSESLMQSTAITTQVHHTTHETGGSDAIAALSAAVLTSGTLPDARLSANVPMLTAANVFTGNPQRIVQNYPAWQQTHPAAPSGSRTWQVSSSGDTWQVQTMDDPGTTALAGPLIALRTGDVRILRDVYEKNRATPLGHWIDVTPVLATNVGTVTLNANYACHYTLLGNTMVLAFYLAITLSAAPTQVTLALPAGFTTAALGAIPFVGPSGFGGMIQTAAGAGVLTLFQNTTGLGAWPTGAQTIGGTATFQIT